MASGVISECNGFKNFGHNITDAYIDNVKSTGIYQAYFQTTSGCFTNVWAIFIVSNVAGNGAVEQVQICTKGIAVRHYENNAWSAWKSVVLS